MCIIILVSKVLIFDLGLCEAILYNPMSQNTAEVNVMKYKIMIITSNYLYSYVRELIDEIGTEYKIDVKIYDNFSNISDIYNAYASEADGIIVSGKIAKEAILNNKMVVRKPIVSFDITVAEIYTSIINLMLKDRNIDLSRVIFDFLIPICDEISASSVLESIDEGSLFLDIEKWNKELRLDYITVIEEQLRKEIVHLWKHNAIDYVICQYSSIIKSLEEEGIPFYYPLPTGEQMRLSIKKLITLIDIDRMRNNFPVVLRIDVLNKNVKSVDKISKTAKSFFAENLMAYNSYIEEDNIRIQLTVSQLMLITDNCKTSKITKYLSDKQKDGFVVSYGIGDNFNKALEHSCIAARESVLKNSSYVVDENETLIGPLDSDSYLRVENNLDDNTIEIARLCNLSTTTVQKIIAITKLNQSKRITTAELSKQLASTVRNANRILQKLVSGGYAKVLLEKTTNTKGRPTKIYELDI